MAKLAQIIEFRDSLGDVMAMRMPAQGEGIIEWGSQLIVREGQVALFFRDGKPMAKFDPGRYVLTTQQIPALTNFISGLVYGKGNTPFRAEVYFVATSLFRDLKWGTPEPVYIPDPVLMQVPVRSHGRFAIRVADASIFVPKLVGTRPRFQSRDIEDYLRSQYLVSALIDGVASLQRSFNELPRFLRELGMGVRAVLAPEFATLGLELVELSVNSISTTEEIQATLNRNVAIVGELAAKSQGARMLRDAGTSYQQVGMTDAMKTMAANPGGGEGGGGGNPMATGMNLGLAMMIPGAMANMMRDPALNPTLNPVGVTTAVGDPVTRLRELKELLDAGVLSLEEYNEKRAVWLDRL
ncbi:MAG TPA: SPFH domain-containing protein [Phycisphaerales bacterium]|nr:SPFH domain-containing protein [Phycisphaerales bacterium]HMP38037.1 SPFH domain-containing protein [Phycisphaerales bacterium]